MSKLQTKGTVKAIYDEKHISERFNTREFVLTTDKETPYPQHVTFQLINSNCDKIIGVKPGDDLTVEFELKGREWNGPQGIKYFNTIVATDIFKTDAE